MNPTIQKTGLAFAAGVIALTLSPSALAQEAQESAPRTEAVKSAAAVETKAKPEKITDRTHPDYMRCRREAVMGSLARKRKICMTNAEWKAFATEGNQRANEFVDENRGTSLPGG